MSKAPVRQSAWSRFGAFVRSLVLPWDPSGSIGAGSAGGVPARPGYDPLRSMSAAAAFPMVYACVSAISEDMAKMPLRLRDGDGNDAKVITDHRFLDLMMRPSARMTQRRFRMQLYTDEALTRNAIWALDEPALRRLHPKHAQPRINRWGEPLGWAYGDLRFSASAVYFVSGPSWSDDTTSIFGMSPMQPLDATLRAMQESLRHTANSAALGRPDFHFSAGEKSPLIAEEAMQRVISKYEQGRREGKSAFFTAGGIEAKQLSWSPKDLESTELQSYGDNATLVVMGVPAVRLGLPNANYGEAKVQMRMYWERLLARAAGFDDEFSRLASDLDEEGRRLFVDHDPTNIEALQTSFDQRQVRAGNWIAIFGMDPVNAAKVEGFDREAAFIPAGPGPGKVPRRPRQDVDEQQEQRQALIGYLAGQLERAAQKYAALRREGASDELLARVMDADAYGMEAILVCVGGVAVERAEQLAGQWARTHLEVVMRAEDPVAHRAFGRQRAVQLVATLGL